MQACLTQISNGCAPQQAKFTEQRNILLSMRNTSSGAVTYSQANCADKIAESYYCSFGLPVTTSVPSILGPVSLPCSYPDIITQALTSDTIKLGSLTPVRDLTYVADTVQVLSNSPKAKNPGKTINTVQVDVTIENLLTLLLKSKSQHVLFSAGAFVLKE